jgi:hypothetical protein
MYPVSNQFLSTLQSSERRVVTLGQVWSPPGPSGTSHWIADLDTIIGGSVTVDETREVRRQCSITLATQGIGKDTLIPQVIGDLLHPATGNMLRLFRGFRYSSPVLQPSGIFSDTELVPLGCFRMSRPKIVDTGNSLTIQITGNDFASWIARLAWQIPYIIPPGTNLGAAIQGILTNRFPGLTYSFSPTALTVARQTLGTAPGSSSNDPMADAQTLATAAGNELFFDVLNTLIMRPLSDPTTSPIVADFQEGLTATFTEVDRVLDETQQFNGVTVIGNGSGGAPVQQTVWDTNPASPTYYLGSWGQVPYIVTTSAFPAPGQSTASAQAQALAMAQTLFPLAVKAMDEVSFTTVPNPALSEGDCVSIERSRIGLSSSYALSQMTIPLDVKTQMSVTCRPRRQVG